MFAIPFFGIYHKKGLFNYLIHDVLLFVCSVKDSKNDTEIDTKTSMSR
ncbi:hypothetical protein TREAZ_0396 [Leadbettera azotonutricia ZAS-9]|uniref:Uncharacterized protein n=1 Tax=Leadbettera azotonutricia (strain ATCC BAA-888 / DSM 13862 / ZAS-9) TaxID=545695 RepID=F5YCX6_LEAAZ|nr:hypothetical protein TREAZ_0396 [Leadbettera azotonutricia ZAS-9]